MLFCYNVHVCVLVSFDLFSSFRAVPNIGHWKANTEIGSISVLQYLLPLTYCNSSRAVPYFGHWKANTEIGWISVPHCLSKRSKFTVKYKDRKLFFKIKLEV